MKNLNYIKLIVQLWKYKDITSNNKLSEKISEVYFGSNSNSNFIYPTVNARNAMYLFFKSLDLPKGSNVIIQSFTCNAAVNPILWAGLEPRYVDTAVDGFNTTLESIKSVVDAHTKVIIVQHTFGVPGDIQSIVDYAKDIGVYVLEDCAHALGSSNGGRMLGTYGDAAVISFGLEKVLSTRVGGALILNTKKLKESVEKEYSKWVVVSTYQTFLWLMNPLVWRVLRLLGSVQGKVARTLNSLGLLNLGYFKSELVGIMPEQYPRKLSGVLSRLSLIEMSGLESNLEHRILVSTVYLKKLTVSGDVCCFGNGLKPLPFVKYPLWFKSEKQYKSVLNKLLLNNVYISNWYNPVVYPASTDLQAMKYEYGVCKNAENLAQFVINLPTGMDITVGRAEEISNIILDSIVF